MTKQHGRLEVDERNSRITWTAVRPSYECEIDGGGRHRLDDFKSSVLGKYQRLR